MGWEYFTRKLVSSELCPENILMWSLWLKDRTVIVRRRVTGILKESTFPYDRMGMIYASTGSTSMEVMNGLILTEINLPVHSCVTSPCFKVLSGCFWDSHLTTKPASGHVAWAILSVPCCSGPLRGHRTVHCISCWLPLALCGCYWICEAIWLQSRLRMWMFSRG